MTSSDSETAVGAAPALNVYSDFYFPDRNIVLDVIEDGATTRFRVHKSLLSRNSPFFAGMFDIPQPPEKPSELVDGCPVINLTGLDYHLRFFNQTQQPVPTVVAMLRLGRKYQFPVLEYNAQQRLRQCYPSTLWGFRSRGQAPCPFDLDHSAELLLVVDEGIIPDDVLPVLFYDHLYILNYHNHPDNSLPANTPLVNEKNVRRLFVGHRRLLATYTCKKAWKDAENFLYASESSGNVIVRPFVTVKLLKNPEINFCDDCRSVVRDALEAGAAEAWRLLPWAFGLGSWAKLMIKEADGKGEIEESNEATNT
ncbi:hypothetical protein AGABI1DRAFT_132200 [Agaricus bisporus var. burnettii JB137-S8]|uniref:BTB domain-containing protein n=1 Tax=Agaricus bisporus var. burnettii (strain JB137-S8 / ATCC MYA-4627 / FGSC 10392) TaxID=597362 RepID=K5XLW7_AGABU|nr:uncharacterized protein AGABI1DRAFT_132200 [Agaricus bisporus var. burnettii JB137-S8]EKM75535.1 hypothetical protein AGABI1DRAFT_132200 [Agaricus bisporus var. burnettii JB137-S8]